MAEFIAPVINQLLTELEARTTSFTEFHRLWTGIAMNVDCIWVMAARTSFAEEGSTLGQVHEITIKFGVAHTDPDELAIAAMARMKEIHEAIEQSWPGTWPEAVSGGQVQGLWIREHDYGPTWEKEGTLAKFPELSLVIEVQELREDAA